MKYLIYSLCICACIFQACEQNGEEQNTLKSEVSEASEEFYIGNWIGNHPNKMNEQFLLQIESQNVAAFYNFSSLHIHTWEKTFDKILFNDVEKNDQMSIPLHSIQDLKMIFFMNGNNIQLQKTQIDSISQINLSGKIKGLEFNDHHFEFTSTTFTSIKSMINDSTIQFNIFKQNGNSIIQNSTGTYGNSLEAGKYYLRIFQNRNHANKNMISAYQFEINLFYLLTATQKE